MPGSTSIRCQVLRQVQHSCPHSPEEPHAVNQQNARLRKGQNGNTFSADNLDVCHRKHPSCNASVAFFPLLLLPFCAPGNATGHFWAQSCPAVHHRFSKLLEPELEMRYSTVHSKLYCTPCSPPPPHPHLPPVKRCHIHQGLSVRREKKICQILNFKWIYPKPLGNSCLRKISVESVFQMQTFGCSVPCCCFSLCSCHTWTCPHLE